MIFNYLCTVSYFLRDEASVPLHEVTFCIQSRRQQHPMAWLSAYGDFTITIPCRVWVDVARGRMEDEALPHNQRRAGSFT